MKANEKRAEALSWGCESVYRATTEKQIATALDAAERRGEERVLRWLRRQDFHGIVYNYKKWKLDLEYVLIDRRARVGRGRK